MGAHNWDIIYPIYKHPQHYIIMLRMFIIYVMWHVLEVRLLTPTLYAMGPKALKY